MEFFAPTPNRFAVLAVEENDVPEIPDLESTAVYNYPKFVKWTRTPDANPNGPQVIPQELKYVFPYEAPLWLIEARRRLGLTPTPPTPLRFTRGETQGLFDVKVEHSVNFNAGIVDGFSSVIEFLRERGWMEAAAIGSQIVIILRNLDDWITIGCCIHTIATLLACPKIEGILTRYFKGMVSSLSDLAADLTGRFTTQANDDESMKQQLSAIFVQMFPYLGSIVSVLIATFMLKGLPGKGTPDELLNRFRSLGPAIKTMQDLSTHGASIAQYVMNGVHYYIFGFEPKQFDSMASVDEWMNDVQQMMSVAASVEIRTSAQAQEKADSLYTRGLQIAKEFDAMRVPAVQQTAFRQFLLASAELRRLAHSSGAGYAVPRFEPVIVQLYGNSGVGKSTLVNALLIDCNRAEGINNYSEITDRIYYRKVGQEFWDGFTSNHKYVVYDDFGQMKDTVLKPNQEFLELIYAGNNAPYPVHMASIAEKASTFFHSGMILLTSNEAAFHVESLTHPDAVRRRFDVRARVRIAPEFGKTSVEGQGLRLDKTKVTLEPDNLDFLKPYRFDVMKEGVFTNPPNDCDFEAQDLTYEEFAKIVIAAHSGKRDHSKLLLETLSSYAARPVVQMKHVTEGERKESQSIPSIVTQVGLLDSTEEEIRKTLIGGKMEALSELEKIFEYASGTNSSIARRFAQYFGFFEQCIALTPEDVSLLPTFGIETIGAQDDERCRQLLSGRVSIERRYWRSGVAIATAISTGRFHNSSRVLRDCLESVCVAHDLSFEEVLTDLVSLRTASKLKSHVCNLQEKIVRRVSSYLEPIRQSILDTYYSRIEHVFCTWVEYREKKGEWVPSGKTSATPGQAIPGTNYWKYELRPLLKRFWHDFVSQITLICGVLSAVFLGQMLLDAFRWLTSKTTKKAKNSKKTVVVVSGRSTEMSSGSPKSVQRTMGVRESEGEESFGVEVEYDHCDKRSARSKLEHYSHDSKSKPRVGTEHYTTGDVKQGRTKTEHYSQDDRKSIRSKTEHYSQDDAKLKRGKVEGSLDHEHLASFLDDVRERETSARFTTQGVVDANAASLCAKLVHRSLYRLEVERNGQWSHCLNVLFVKGRIAVTNAHLVYMLQKNPGKKLRLTGASCVDGFVFEAKDLKYVVASGKFADRDVMLIEFPRALRQHPDITSHFASANDYSKFHTVKKVALIGYLPISALLSQIHTTDKAVALDVVMEVDEPSTRSVLKLRQAFGYPIETAQGECGSVLISMEPAMNHKLLGIHSVGGTHHYYTGCATPVTQEMLSAMENDLHPRMDAMISLPECFDEYKVSVVESQSVIYMNVNGNSVAMPRKLDGQCFTCEIDQTIGKNFIALGKADRELVGSGKTGIRRSPLHGYVEPLTAPARLGPFRNAEGIIVNPENLARKKADMAPASVNELHLQRAALDVQRMLNSLTEKSTCKRVLDHAESIVGIDGSEWFDSINRKASAGRPWRDNLTLADGTKSSGKHKWLSVGGMADGDFRVDEPELLKAVEKRIDEARNGRRSSTIWCDTLKDERRPIDRVKQGKTRLFSVGPVDYNLAFRRYFLSFIAFVMDNRINAESCVGVNPFSLEWSRVARRCTIKGNHVLAGDFSNFDGTLSGQILWAILDMINAWYDDGRENAEIRRVLWSEIVHSVHQTGGTYYGWNHSQPSGNPATVIINCLYNSIAVRIAWLHCTEGMAELHSMKGFNDNVVMVCYGDDNVIGVAPEVHHIFNMETLTAAFARFGMIYTDESKSGSVTAFRKITEISFLKRDFRFDPEQRRYRAPLALKTIRDMVQFVRGDLDIEESCGSNVEMAMYELSQWDKDTFDVESSLMLEACAQAGIFPVLDTYEGYNECEYIKYVDASLA